MRDAYTFHTRQSFMDALTAHTNALWRHDGQPQPRPEVRHA